MATLSCTSVASSAAAGASHKSGSYIVDGYTSRSSMGLSTSGQPTSTAGELYHQCVINCWLTRRGQIRRVPGTLVLFFMYTLEIQHCSYIYSLCCIL